MYYLNIIAAPYSILRLSPHTYILSKEGVTDAPLSSLFSPWYVTLEVS